MRSEELANSEELGVRSEELDEIEQEIPEEI